MLVLNTNQSISQVTDKLYRNIAESGIKHNKSSNQIYQSIVKIIPT
jgi:hypothetical protein